MLLSTTILALILSLATCVSAAKRRLYLISSKKMLPREVKRYCHSKGGWGAVIDKQNLEEALAKMDSEGVSEVHVGKRLRRKLRNPMVRLTKAKTSSRSGKRGAYVLKGKLTRASKHHKQYALCQAEAPRSGRKSRRASSSSEEESSSSEEKTHKSRRPRAYKHKGPSGRTYEFSNRH